MSSARKRMRLGGPVARPLAALLAAALAGLAKAAALPLAPATYRNSSDAPPSASPAVPQGPPPAAQTASPALAAPPAPSPGTVLAVGQSVNMTLAQDESWRGVVEAVSSDSTLIVNTQVWRARSCAEGAAVDGTCIFGLKLLGSSTPHGLPIEQIDEHQHLAGKPYELIVSSCALRRHARGTPPVSSYHVSLLGWDGVSELSLSTEQSRLPMLRPYCPLDAQDRPPALHSHTAVLVAHEQHAAAGSPSGIASGSSSGIGSVPSGASGTMFVFGGSLLGSGPQSTPIPGEDGLDGPDEGRRLNQDEGRGLKRDEEWRLNRDEGRGLNRDEERSYNRDERRLNPISVRPRPHRPSDELWALDVGKREWRRLGPPEGVRTGSGGATASRAGPAGGAGTWPSARSAHTMTRSSRGDVYVFGGRTGDEPGGGRGGESGDEPGGGRGGEPVSTALNDLWVMGCVEGGARPPKGSAGGGGVGGSVGGGGGGVAAGGGEGGGDGGAGGGVGDGGGAGTGRAGDSEEGGAGADGGAGGGGGGAGGSEGVGGGGATGDSGVGGGATTSVYWRQLLPIGAAPQGRRYHAATAVTIPGEGESLVVIGGLSEPSMEEDLSMAPADEGEHSRTGSALRGAVVLRDVWRLPLEPAMQGEYSGGAPFADAAASGDGTVSWQPHAAMRVVNPREAAEQPAERYGHSACGWQGIVFVFGGVHRWAGGDAGSPPAVSPVQALGIAADLWELRLEGRGAWVRVQGGGRGPSGRAFHTATVVGDVMLVYGGVDARGVTLNDLWALHLSSRTWALLRPHDTSRLGPFVGRSRHTAVALPPPATDVLIFGGLSGYSSTRDGPLLSVSDEAFLRVRPPNCPASAAPPSAINSFAQARAAALQASGPDRGILGRAENSLDQNSRRRLSQTNSAHRSKNRVAENSRHQHSLRRLSESTPSPDPQALREPLPAALREGAPEVGDRGISVAAEFAAGRGCVPCLPGTRAVVSLPPDTPAESNSSHAAPHATCERCEAGWLSLTSGAGACSPCPPGTFSALPGASSWRECTLCPSGTFSSHPGAASCLSCETSWQPHDPAHPRIGGHRMRLECPPGSTHPTIDPRPWDEETGDEPSGGAGSSSFFGVISDTYPKALSSYTSTDRSLATIQLIITLLGGLSFFFFVLFLSVSAIFQPQLAERLLRTADVPPISGGPGNSRAGGLFTIAYAFFYSSFALAFVLQFLFFNERVSVSLIPTPSELFATTAVTFSTAIHVAGYAAEACTQPDVPPGKPGPCAEGISIRATGMRIPFGINTSCARLGPAPSPTPLLLPPAALPAPPACIVTYHCVECSVESAEAELLFSLSGRFAYAHSVTWDASTSWSATEPIPGRSSLRASIQPNNGRLLRGAESSIVTLALVPTVYENNINNTRARGFQLQYLATAMGSTIEPRALDPEQVEEGAVDFAVRLQPLAQEYLLTVHLVRTLVELIASLMALGSGFSFVCRFSLWFYLKTMHAGASKFGSKFHAEVLRGSLAVRGGPEERHLRRESSRPLKARGDRLRGDGQGLKRYWSHNDGLSRRATAGLLDLSGPPDTRPDSSESGDMIEKEDSMSNVMPTATAAPWLWPQMSESLGLPGLRTVFTRIRPAARRGFMRLVDEADDAEAGRAQATSAGGAGSGESIPRGAGGRESGGRSSSGSRLAPPDIRDQEDSVGSCPPPFNLAASGVPSPGNRYGTLGHRRQRSASGQLSGALSSARRRHRRSMSQDSLQPELLGSLLKDAHLHLQRKSSDTIGGGAENGADGSTTATGSPVAAHSRVPAVYSYGEGSLEENSQEAAGPSEQAAVDVADDEAHACKRTGSSSIVNRKASSSTLIRKASSSTLIRNENLTVTTPTRHSDATGTPVDGTSAAPSEDSPDPHRLVRRLRERDEMPLTPPHGHPHYTVVAGIRSP